MGHVPEEIRVAGGAARSKALKTILAAALGAPVRESSRQEAGAAGAAMMAAVAIGVFPNLGVATQRWVTPLLGDLVQPDPGLADLYARAFPAYVATRAAMPPIWARARRPSLRYPRMTEIAIIGDRFMLPDAFATALRRVVGPEASLRTLELPWPDEPMVHGYAGSGLEGLKEYQGDPEAIVEFVGGAVDPGRPSCADHWRHARPPARAEADRGQPRRSGQHRRGRRAGSAAVRVVNTPGRNASAVAEFTIAAILVETRLIRAGHEALRRGEWRGDLYRADLTGTELSELTVGLIGYGEIGTRVVPLLKPFGCRILVCDPYKQLSAADVADGVIMTDFDTLLAESDVVSLHARVTDETRGFLAAPQFARMKAGAYFINTARGPMVNYDDLYHALKSGHVRGAMLETFWQEPPPPDAPLLRLDNVTLTPHIAGASTTTVRIAARMAAEEVRRWLAGEPPLNPC